MTKNALHLSLTFFDSNSGVDQKITSQLYSLKNNGFNKVFKGMFNENNWFCIDNVPIAKRQSISHWWPQKRFYSKLIDFVKENKISFVYFRFNCRSEPAMIWFFHKLKQLGIVSVMEIPTYPYEGELKKDRFYYLDKLTRGFLSKQMHSIVTFSDKKVIFGQRTINISNGVDFNKLPIRQFQNSSTFNILGVANLRYWHGYDRVIRGLANYIKEKNHPEVYFHIVSGKENNDVRELRELTKTLSLEKYVVFHGEVVGEELDLLFNKCQIAVGSLGRHRNKIYSLKTLKNVEYAARGIPFVYSENNEDFDDKPYVIKADPDERPINIVTLIDRFSSITLKSEEIRESVKSLSWDNQIAKIVKEVYK